MQKIIAALALLLITSSLASAQEITDKSATIAPLPIVKPSRDFVMLQFAYNNWQNKPDSVKTKSFNYGFNGYLCYDFPIKKTHLSFATGIGINANVIYLDQQVLAVSDTGLNGAAARFLPSGNAYKRYKFVTAYLQAPFELRYYSNINNRNKAFKVAVGLQVGTLMGAHTKGTRSVEGAVIKDKENTKRYISPWNFAATARIGYGNFSVFGSYNLTNVFKDNLGPPITPMSIGICLTGL